MSLTALLGIELPILQAPMAGAQDSALTIAVCQAGGLGSLPCAMFSVDQVRAEVDLIRSKTDRPFGLNFFCHQPPSDKPDKEAIWKEKLAEFYQELGLDPNQSLARASRNPFDERSCQLVEELRPAVLSFHFGLPDPGYVERIKATGAILFGTATTVAEAKWLEERGCDVVIAQGSEAGGHRGMFLATDPASQVGTMALVPQVVDAVSVPVVATGGIMDARGIVAGLALGASAVQLGTAYLFCPEARIKPVHREALRNAFDDATVLTNVFSGRPARGIRNRLIEEIGPLSNEVPDFPIAGIAIAPLRAKSEATGSPDFAQMWSGQGASLGMEMSAFALTKHLAAGIQEVIEALR